jgi:hypothetical protein
MLLATIVPNLYSMPWEVVKCWFEVLLDGNNYKFYSCQGSTLSNNRNRVWKNAQFFSDNLLFIDSDIIFTPDDVAKIEQHLKTYDIVTGVYVLGFPPYNPAIFKRVEADYEFMPIPATLSQIGACGAGFLGISARAIKILGDNPFSNQWEGEVVHGEDVSFSHLCNEKGLKVMCDPTILLGQLRTNILRPNEN